MSKRRSSRMKEKDEESARKALKAAEEAEQDKYALYADEEVHSLWDSKDAFLDCITCDAEDAQNNEVTVMDHPALPAAMKEILYEVKNKKGRVLVMFIHDTQSVAGNHICSHKIVKQVLWHHRFEYTHPVMQAWSSFWQGLPNSLLLCISAPNNKWMFLGWAIRRSTWSAMEAPFVSDVHRPHYEGGSSFVLETRINKAAMETLGDPSQRCKINRYGSSLCKCSDDFC